MTDTMPGFQARTDEDAQKTIFIVESENGTGSGFLIHDSHHVLTANHVIEGSRHVKVKVRSMGETELLKDYFASIEKTWETLDVALLHLDEPIQGVKPFDLSPQELLVSKQIRTFGFPGIFGEGWHRAEIAGGPLNDGKYDIDFKTNYPDTLEGLSGGPIFISEDTKYRVVGIITNHGPLNFQKGKIVPTKAFYSELSEIFEREIEESIWCYTLLSGADIDKKNKHDPDTLEQAVRTAFKNDAQVKVGTKRLVFDVATELVSSPKHYKNAIKKICQARIAIFDVTRFEPAIMLLLGVRAVVRRGVTIVSTGDFIIGDAFDIPFNIKELTIVSHAKKQYISNETKTPPEIIRDKIEEGLNQLTKLSQYLDLPAFDAVRNLPPDYRAPDPLNVLVLCPYSKKYQMDNWVNLEKRLRPLLSKGGKIVRILDLMSPRLVSSTIYEAIRRKDLCLVDWTEWRPNVFFEFGVRLALTGPKGFTVSIIEGRQKYLIHALTDGTSSDDDICKLARITNEELRREKEKYSYLTEQCNNLLKLFNPLVYYTLSFTDSPGDGIVDDSVQFDLNAYENMLYYYNYQNYSNVEEPALSYGRAPSFTYEVIESYIDIRDEPACTPVYIDLLRTAELFGIERDNSQTSVLYPKNALLNRNVENGITQRLLAAWYYLRQEHTNEKEIVGDANLFDAYQRIGLTLHDHIQETRPDLADDIANLLEALQLEALQRQKGSVRE